jgi:hypothetical protein
MRSTVPTGTPSNFLPLEKEELEEIVEDVQEIRADPEAFADEQVDEEGEDGMGKKARRKAASAQSTSTIVVARYLAGRLP